MDQELDLDAIYGEAQEMKKAHIDADIISAFLKSKFGAKAGVGDNILGPKEDPFIPLPQKGDNPWTPSPQEIDDAETILNQSYGIPKEGSNDMKAKGNVHFKRTGGKYLDSGVINEKPLLWGNQLRVGK